MQPITVTSALVLPLASLSWSAARASGPGGQNVNKVSSKVELRFDPELAPLDEPTKARLRTLAGPSRLDGDGRVVIVSQVTRDQPRNLEDAREKLRELVALATVRPKKRRPTKPSRRAQARRMDDKSHHAKKKTARKARDD